MLNLQALILRESKIINTDNLQFRIIFLTKQNKKSRYRRELNPLPGQIARQAHYRCAITVSRPDVMNKF